MIGLLAALSGCTPTTNPDAQLPVPPPANTVQDVFLQTTVDTLDLVFVVDTGWGQAATQVASNLVVVYERLLLTDPDWRIGWMTSNPADPRQLGRIGGPDLLDGRGGRSTVRQAIDAALTDQADYFADDAHIVFVVVTDRPDQSDDDQLPYQDFLDRVSDSEVGRSIQVSAITSDDLAIEEYWSAMTADLAGITRSVGSWEAALDDTVLHSVGHHKAFMLSAEPAAPPRQLTVTSRDRDTLLHIDEDFVYHANDNEVRLNVSPVGGSEIRVSYTVP